MNHFEKYKAVQDQRHGLLNPKNSLGMNFLSSGLTKKLIFNFLSGLILTLIIIEFIHKIFYNSIIINRQIVHRNSNERFRLKRCADFILGCLGQGIDRRNTFVFMNRIGSIADGILMKLIKVHVFCLYPFFAKTQVITAFPMMPLTQDTLLFMADHLPVGIKYWPFNSDSTKWDLNGVKAPYIRRAKLLKDEELPVEFGLSNRVIQISASMMEYMRITSDSILSFGVTGMDLFNNGHLYSGSYHLPRVYKSRNSSIDKVAASLPTRHKLVYDCRLEELPVQIQQQLPYRPDSLRVITTIEEHSYFIPNITLDLNLQRYNTRLENKLIVQSTRIETCKATLKWQDVTRFVKYPKLFKTDTIRISSFYVDQMGTPVASLYYKNKEEIEQILYRAPETFKDLIIVDDYKPNLFFFPNPYSVGTLRCEMVIKSPGLYTARVVNLIGNELWRQNYYFETSKTIDLEFPFLNKGTYFMVLEQDKNHVIATKRLLVIKP